MPKKVATNFAVQALLAALVTSSSYAETQTMKYDVLGRLTRVCHSIGAGYKATYSHDAASNRSNVTGVTPGFGLAVGNSIYSPDGRFFLVMQGDGNLVLYGPSGALWASNTSGTTANYASFQADGNLVLYGLSGVYWASNTQSWCAYLQLQNDGNLVIYSADGAPVWASNTGGH